MNPTGSAVINDVIVKDILGGTLLYVARIQDPSLFCGTFEMLTLSLFYLQRVNILEEEIYLTISASSWSFSLASLGLC